MMLVGISLIGVVTASIAAWFLGRVEDAESGVAAELRAIREEVERMRSEQV